MDRPRPINQEVQLADDEFIVSKTDPKGRITYANRVFMRISGYTEQQLLGAPHNILRHPDMPRGAFYLMWKTLQEGNEFFAIVKNLTADGKFYWVFANITPDYDLKGNLIGYYSVRRKPSKAAIQGVTPIYQKMLEIERGQSASSAPAASAQWLASEILAQGTQYESHILGLQQS